VPSERARRDRTDGGDTARRRDGPNGNGRTDWVLSKREETFPLTPGTPDLTGRSLEIQTARNGDTVTVEVAGELDLATAEALERVLVAVEETEPGRIVIDLSELYFADSTGLRTLLQFKQRSNGRLSFIPSQHGSVTRLLALTGTAELLAS
jgi:anti-sigma B factor antagonist